MPIHRETTQYPVVHIGDPSEWDLVGQVCSGYLAPGDLRHLRTDLTNVRTVVVEKGYIDKDYRDTFANFYAKKFADYPSRTIRLHFFRCEVPPDSIWELAKYQADFIGFSVIRPTRVTTIGRTMLNPRLMPNRKGTMCLAKYKANILGNELEVEAFPFMRQDSDVTVCAHAAAWMVFRYFSEKYPRYREHWPYEITQLTTDYSGGRLVPSAGVTIGQLAEMFYRFGFHPKVYFRKLLQSQFPADPDLFDRLLYFYIESGLPVVASLPAKSHALTVLGHLSDYTTTLPAQDFASSYGYVRGWVVNDDNHLPYQIVSEPGTGVPQHPRGFTRADVAGFVVPLYEKIHLLAEDIEQRFKALIESSLVGLAATRQTLKSDEAIVRIFLTSSRSYKRVRVTTGPPQLGRIYAYSPMPKFIWVAELSTRDLYPTGKIVGEVIWDATANQIDPFSFLYIHYPSLLIINDRHSLSRSRDRFTEAKMALGPYDLYRNNLQEVA
jgi:hypothetical protein